MCVHEPHLVYMRAQAEGVGTGSGLYARAGRGGGWVGRLCV